VKLLHTSDWQLGLRLNFVGGDAAVRLRAQRFDTVRRIGRLARERQVDAVLVAGDVFDDNGVGADTVQQARDALAEFGDIPVILLPGNHDPATADSALRRLLPTPEHVHLALTREVITVGGATRPLEIYPCPLMTRHHYDDPAAWLPGRGDSTAIRVAVAHGGALSFGETTETPNRIDVAAILGRGFDYVALGDWHGVYQVAPQAWHAGAPEATRYKEKQPGYVLIVDIDAPGAEPRVEQVPVARTRWLTQTLDLASDDSLDALAARLDALEEKSWTLLELTLHGQLSLAGQARLEALLDDYRGRLAHLRVDAGAVTAAPTASDLDTLRGEGFLGRAIERLRGGEDPADADALRLLYRLMQEPHS
jgi:DNA repair exonuclease SbcCD nuclease subunit